MMYETVQAILDEAKETLAKLKEPDDIHKLRVELLGRKGKLTQALRGLAALPAQERPQAGSVANAAKTELEELIGQRLRQVLERQHEARWERERIDVTLPGHPLLPGVPHVLAQTRQQIEDIFIGLGFSIAEGPEVETDAYNFVALNIPQWHPARDMQATFYAGPDQVLRTHTSPVQIRSMRERAPGIPLRVIAPGRVYRRDPADATHLPVFTQIEGLVVDADATMGDLCGVLLEWARQFFGPATRVRL
ncbi:MAG TPA: phenylalanine--tRNA ligase subunit alpha, partial [Clostridiales bacterium UBA8153]|nr:phenylalanine--tRNA ligase subunit alpha [Clostridiales bacterium UBA8153]